ncbi:MAG: LacI family DNA-binding transcriptional regulator [bacterium]|jgi:LacI family transcriptional regulator|nr:LacI family DNA-binding transcriptional regulator [bacterium]MDD4557893.1 LacI family DNA-binding transcriptional regulator [bacterium]
MGASSQQRRATLKDIAEMTGLSINTVSRALRDKPDIGEDTKRRVREVAASLDYSPNLAARQRALKRRYRIGVILPNIGNYISSSLFDALDEGLSEYGYTAIAFYYRDIARMENHLEPVIAGKVDGMVVMAGGILPDDYQIVIDRLLMQAIPFVIYNRFGIEYDCVITDMEAAALMAAEHFVEMGRYDIAYLCSSNAHLESSAMQGITTVLASKSLPVFCRQALLREDTSMSGYQGMNELLKSEKIPEAVFCCTDQIAFGAMRAVEESPLSIPEDIAVCGFGNTPESLFYKPSLMTFDLRIRDIAAGILSLLTARIEDLARPPEQLTIQPKLVTRESGKINKR